MESRMAFLLGHAFAGMKEIQDNLMQGDHQKALSLINEQLRYLKAQIDVNILSKEAEPADANIIPDTENTAI